LINLKNFAGWQILYTEQHPKNEIAGVILLLKNESKRMKINELRKAMQDNLFMNDLDEISRDFKEIDREGYHT
jgi:hypothetical protein